MAGGAADNPNLKGLSRIFNSETNFGRANVSIHKFIDYFIETFQTARAIDSCDSIFDICFSVRRQHTLLSASTSCTEW